ncbi:uncharacterized protein MONOS_17924 [Monocercomonoides exilis]|uniref:uncharacterized protein n=1 Tax=Monocercomonoides exilis TaxID=2049356 RepID=UPI00355ABD19|nr:hypothetical protein MONOS_17924 [Monocercomonoides exilis]
MSKEMSITEKFTALFDGIEECYEEEQMQKIEEMNEMVNEMNKEEFGSIFKRELYEKIDDMIEEKKLSVENVILLLKHVGYCKMLKYFYEFVNDYSSLNDRFQEMIIEEEEKKEEKNERLLVDLCECFTLLNFHILSDELTPICVPCLLKVALKKEENEETQKEVEMALLCLSCIDDGTKIEQKLYLNEITEIIKYHQEHQNLTRLAYRSAWMFLTIGFFSDESLEELITNELHFAREARREIEELKRNVDWKRKKVGKETEVKEVLFIKRWISVIWEFLYSNTLWNEECEGLIDCIVKLFLASRDNHKDILNGCLGLLRNASEKRNMEIDAFVKKGVIDLFLEQMKQSTLDDEIMWKCLYFFFNISWRLKEKKDDEKEKEERKELKRKIFERFEEEGYDDFITCFHGVISFRKNIYRELSGNISDYFVNV